MLNSIEDIVDTEKQTNKQKTNQAPQIKVFSLQALIRENPSKDFITLVGHFEEDSVIDSFQWREPVWKRFMRVQQVVLRETFK